MNRNPLITMKKADLIKAIIRKHGLAICQTAILQTCLDEIVSGLANGEAVELRRFGVFKTKKQKARTIIHPKTEKPIKHPTRTIVLFEAGSTVKTALNKPGRRKKNDH